jgi:hypothetical protein
MSGASGCGRFGFNEADGPSKTNDEFVAITRPLDSLLRLSNARPLLPMPRAAPPTVVVVAGARLAIPALAPAATRAIVDGAREAAAAALAKLDADKKVAQEVTKPETKVAADKVVAAQAEADAVAKMAEEKAMKAKAAAEEAEKAAAVAKSTGSAADVQTAQVVSQIADTAHVEAEQATVAATEVAATADAARSALEATATAANDVPAQEATTEATMTVATTGLGPLGISWMAWGVGAAALVGGYLFMNSRAMSKNRRVRRNRRRR